MKAQAMKKVQLRNSKRCIIVDDETYPRVRLYPCYLCTSSIRVWNGFRMVSIGQFLFQPSDPKIIYDHINRNAFDCRLSNFREATRTENSRNRKKSAGTTSSFKGVFWNTEKGRWRAQIYVNGKLIFLGYFHLEIDAAKAYDQAARHWHKEFASLNFPDAS